MRLGMAIVAIVAVGVGVVAAAGPEGGRILLGGDAVVGGLSGGAGVSANSDVSDLWTVASGAEPDVPIHADTAT